MATSKKTKAYGDGDLFGPPKLDNTPTQEELNSILSSGKKSSGTSRKATARRSVSSPKTAPKTAPKIGSHSPFMGIYNQANPMSDKQAANFFAQRKADPIGSIQKSKAPANLAAVLAQPKTSNTRSRGGTFGDSSGGGGGLLKFFDKDYISGLIAAKNKGQELPSTAGVAEEFAPVPTFGKTLADYLAGAGDGSSLVSGELGAIDARSQALKGQAVVSDEAIAKIYAGLQNSLSKSGEDAGARYAAAGEAAQGVQDGTAATIAAAQKNSESQQAAIRKNLGMEDLAPSAAQNYQAVDQSNAQSALAATGKSQQDYMQSLGTANQDFFTANNAAAGFRGAESRAGLQTDLTSRLAALQDERSSTLAEASTRAQQLAMQQYQADYGQWADQRSYSDGLSDKQYDRNFAERQYSDDLTYRQQQMDAEYGKQQAANQPEAPAYDKIQQQLLQAMPSHTWAVQRAMEVMATQKNSDPKSPKYKPMSLQTFLENGLNEQQARLALQAYSEYANAYKY